MASRTSLRGASARSAVPEEKQAVARRPRRRRIPTESMRLYNPVGAPFFPRAPPSDNTVHSFHQVVTLANIASSASADVKATYTFSESLLDQHASFESIFDQYRITRVEFWTMPVSPDVATATSNLGVLLSVVDYDDATTLASYASTLDYENVQQSPGCNGHYRSFIPHAAVAAYSGSFTSYSNVTSPWIDCASNAVQHFGVKLYWTTTDAVYEQATYCRIHVQYRNVR